MEAALDALASYVRNMLVEMAKEEIHILLGVSGEIDTLDTKLRDLMWFLADAERKNITEQRVQVLVRELKDVMYDATDILDLCRLKANEQGPRHDAGCLNPLLFCMRNPLHAHDIGNRVKNLNQRLAEIKKRGMDLGFINLGSYEDKGRSVSSSSPDSIGTSQELDKSSLVGEKIEEDTRILVEKLTSVVPNCKDNKLMVFAIVGVGGIGKSTLARHILDHDVIQNEFPKKIWLSVGQDITGIELLRRAVTEARGRHHSVETTRGSLERALKKALNGCKTFLVMDDVWDHKWWDNVLKTLLFNILGHGSRVLVTTRHNNVAKGMMAEKPYHRIDKLEPEHAWTLLKKQVVGNENDERHIENLRDIGMGIIEKCDGLPLAVKVMGGVLRHKNLLPSEWGDVLTDSKWSESEMPPELNNAIYLSYQAMDPHLKPCFLQYSLIPKDSLLLIHDIVAMWISDGLIHGTTNDLEKIGKRYYDELIQRNLIEPKTEYTDQQLCKMHDLVRLFCQYVIKEEALVAHNNESDISGKLNAQKFIRLSLKTTGSEPNELEWRSLQAQSSLRTLISVGRIKIMPSDSLVTFSSLRTLYIEDAKIDALVESLHKLKHLRYLSITYNIISRLPESIGKMQFLEYISLLCCTSLVALPHSITKLSELRFLNLTGTRINNIPRGFNGLTNLRKLYGFPAHMDGDWCSLEELGPLSQLTMLDIKGMENVSSPTYAIKASLSKKVRLSHLHLTCTIKRANDGRLVMQKQRQCIEEVYDELCPPPCLETLTIEGYIGRRLPTWMMLTALEPLGGLRSLMLKYLPCCTELPDGICQLPFLETLRIVYAPAIKCVGRQFLCQNSTSHVGAVFPRMQKLSLEDMLEWEEWEWEEQVQAMPALEFLHIERCKLRRVPPSLAIHARALKKLRLHYVKHLKCLENFASVVHLQVLRNTDLERISNLQNLKELVIAGCPKVKLLEGVPSLHRLILQDYEMETIPTYIKDVKPRQLLLDCTLQLLTSVAAGKSSPEWDKFSHIQQVKAHADDDENNVMRKWHVLYKRHPFSFETNISRCTIDDARAKRQDLRCWTTCTIGDEWPAAGRHVSEDIREPLCLRFRCNAHRRLFLWLRRACLHCNVVVGIASSPSDKWMLATPYGAGLSCVTRFGRLQQQNATSSV